LGEINNAPKNLKAIDKSETLINNNDDDDGVSYSEKKIASTVRIANTFSRKSDISFNLYEGGGCVWTVSVGGGPGTGKKDNH
jgi:hypothetical protein